MPGGSGVVGFIWTPSVTLSGLDTGPKEGWKKLPATSQVSYYYYLEIVLRIYSESQIFRIF